METLLPSQDELTEPLSSGFLRAESVQCARSCCPEEDTRHDTNHTNCCWLIYLSRPYKFWTSLFSRAVERTPDTRQLSPTRHRCSHPGKPNTWLTLLGNCRDTSSGPDSTETSVGNEKVMVSLSSSIGDAGNLDFASPPIYLAASNLGKTSALRKHCAHPVVSEIVASTTSSKFEPHTEAHQRASPAALRGTALSKAKSGESSCAVSRRALWKCCGAARRGVRHTSQPPVNALFVEDVLTQ